MIGAFQTDETSLGMSPVFGPLRQTKRNEIYNLRPHGPRVGARLPTPSRQCQLSGLAATATHRLPRQRNETESFQKPEPRVSTKYQAVSRDRGIKSQRPFRMHTEALLSLPKPTFSRAQLMFFDGALDCSAASSQTRKSGFRRGLIDQSVREA